jgi:DNA-binding NarL/FixJ family response regulator
LRVRCLIVDDNGGFLAAARRLLEGSGVTVVGAASSSAEAIELAKTTRPDVALVDIDLGAESGIDLVPRLHEVGAHPVILMSAHSADDFLDPIASSGAIGFVAKSELTFAAICDVLSGSASVKEGDHR